MSTFKAPAWAQNLALSDSEESDRELFSHSKNFLAVQKESIEQRKRKEAEKKQTEAERQKRRKEKAERRESKKGVKRESTDAEEKGSLKKRRITSDETAKLLALAGVKPISLDDSESEGVQYEPAELPVRRSPRTQRTRDVLDRPNQRSALGRNHDGTEESEGGVEITAVTAKPAPPPPEEEVDSDPEIAALQMKAREKTRLRLDQEQRSSTPGAANSGRDTSTGLPTPPPPDPTISIFITSDIPNTQPLLIKRKLSQDLKPVREAWCAKQGFSKEFTGTVFFTWCLRKLYDFTTCQRLGIEVDSKGNVVRADERGDDGAAKVHLVAMTESLLAEAKAERTRKARLDPGEVEAEQQAEATPAPEEQPAEAKMIKLVVKAKDRPDFKVRVNPTTAIAKILKSAKRSFGMSSDIPGFLSFDGDRLDPDDLVSNTELEDMDNLEFVLGD